MSLLESLNQAGHRMVDLLAPNPNARAERALAQPLPAVSYLPVNAPGSTQPLVSNAWYRLINSADKEVGFMFYCRCGANNAYLASPRYDLQRELEQKRPCCARCVDIKQEQAFDKDGKLLLGEFKQVRNTEKDKDGNLVPVGAYHNLLDLLPDQGEKMDVKQRNMVYATLPTWRLVNEKQAPPFMTSGDFGGNLPGESSDVVGWDGSRDARRDRGFASGDPGFTGLF